MSRETERRLITQHFSAAWQAQYSTIPVAWPNTEFSTPVNGKFLVVNFVDRGTTRESLGRSYLKRHRGTLQLDLYVPAGEGIGFARNVADYVEEVYDSLDLLTTDGEPVYFRTPSSREIGGNEARASNLEDNWYRYVIECPYDRQEIVIK